MDKVVIIAIIAVVAIGVGAGVFMLATSLRIVLNMMTTGTARSRMCGKSPGSR